MDLSTQALILVGVVTLVGAALGAAVAQWRRGPDHRLIGGVIGGLAAFLFAFVATIYAGVVVALGIFGIVALILFGWMFS